MQSFLEFEHQISTPPPACCSFSPLICRENLFEQGSLPLDVALDLFLERSKAGESLLDGAVVSLRGPSTVAPSHSQLVRDVPGCSIVVDGDDNDDVVVVLSEAMLTSILCFQRTAAHRHLLTCVYPK